MREIIFFVGSLAGAAVLTALAVMQSPESALWRWMLWIGAALFLGCAVFLGLDYLWPKRSPLYLVGIGLGVTIVVASVFAFVSETSSRVPFFYFGVDIVDSADLRSANPGRIINDDDHAFYNVSAWFSPSAGKRNPDPPDGLYWSLRNLKVDWTPLHKGAFRTGKAILPGDYCVEINAIRDGKSLAFIERLQVVPFENVLVQIIDVWQGAGGPLLYSSQRPAGFSDSPVPWTH